MERIRAVILATLVVLALGGGATGVVADAHTPGDVTGPGTPGDADDRCEFPVTVTDATGEELTLEEPPERITTTNPSAAQVLWELHAQDRVVGVTRYAAYLDGAAERTDVSAETGVSRELIADTEPDLVLAPNASAEAVEPLRNDGHVVYHFPEATDVDDIAAKTERIGLLVDECEAAAETNAWMYEEVDAVRERTAGVDRPTALYPLGSGFVAAGDTFIDEIMTIGGVDNVAAAEHTGYPQLSPEVVIDADPELILVIERNEGIIEEHPYSQTTAGLNGNTVEMQVHYLNQPAPRSVVESTRTLADAVEAYHDEGSGESVDESPNGNDTADGDAAAEDEGAGDAGGDDEGPNGSGASGDGTSGVAAPGFGVAVAVLAVLIASGALVARQR